MKGDRHLPALLFTSLHKLDCSWTVVERRSESEGDDHVEADEGRSDSEGYDYLAQYRTKNASQSQQTSPLSDAEMKKGAVLTSEGGSKSPPHDGANAERRFSSSEEAASSGRQQKRQRAGKM